MKKALLPFLVTVVLLCGCGTSSDVVTTSPDEEPAQKEAQDNSEASDKEDETQDSGDIEASEVADTQGNDGKFALGESIRFTNGMIVTIENVYMLERPNLPKNEYLVCDVLVENTDDKESVGFGSSSVELYGDDFLIKNKSELNDMNADELEAYTDALGEDMGYEMVAPGRKNKGKIIEYCGDLSQYKVLELQISNASVTLPLDKLRSSAGTTAATTEGSGNGSSNLGNTDVYRDYEGHYSNPYDSSKYVDIEYNPHNDAVGYVTLSNVGDPYKTDLYVDTSGSSIWAEDDYYDHLPRSLTL